MNLPRLERNLKEGLFKKSHRDISGEEHQEDILPHCGTTVEEVSPLESLSHDHNHLLEATLGRLLVTESSIETLSINR